MVTLSKSIKILLSNNKRGFVQSKRKSEWGNRKSRWNAGRKSTPNLTKTNKKFAFATIEDFNGKAELVIWSDAYSKFYHLLDEDRIVLVVGKGEVREENPLKIYVSEIYPIEEALSIFIEAIHIYLVEDKNAKQKLNKFAKMCNSPDTAIKVLFILKNNGERKAFVAENVHFALNEDNLSKLVQIFGEESIRFIPKNL